MRDNDILQEAKQAFDLAYEAESDNRLEALDDIKFARLGEQWPEEVRRQREHEGRPCLTINRLPNFIRNVVNEARQNKPSIKCHPVDSVADPETAELMNGLIRNIENISNADVAYDTAMENSVTAGIGYWRINLEYAHDDSFDMDIKIASVPNIFSVYGDPYSTAADSSDWTQAHVTELITRDLFRQKYKGADEVDWEDLGYTQLNQPWSEGEQILLAEYWTREEVTRKIVQLSNGSVVDVERYLVAKDAFDALGITMASERETKSWKVKQYIMTGAEILEENDWPGKYIPIVPVYGDVVNVEGKRYLRSLIRDAKDPQRQFNYWRTTSTESIALAPKAPFIGPKGAFRTDSAKWNSANSKSHAYLEYDGPIPPQRQPYAGPAAGALQEAMNATDDLKSVMGIFDAALGAKSNETSGVAIKARQQESNTGTFHFVDNLARAIRHTGLILLDLIPTVYDAGRVIRILGEDGEGSENVELGAPHQGKEGAEKIYDLSMGKYDLTVKVGPSFTSQRNEAASSMIEFIQAYPLAAPLLGDLIADNLDWPGADKIAARLKTMLPPQLQEGGQDPQMQQMQQQLQQMQQQLQQASEQMHQMQQDKAIETEKVKVDAYNAETNRLKITQPLMGQEAIQLLVMQTIQQVMGSPNEQQPQQMGQINE